MSNKTIVLDEKNAEIKKVVKVSGDEWTSLVEKAKKEVSSKIKVPGYRPGKAPKHILEQRLNMGDVFNKALNQYLAKNEKAIFEEVQKESKRVIFAPSLELKKVSEEELELEVIFPLDTDLDKIDLSKAKAKIAIEKPTAKDVDDFIAERLKETALLLPIDKKDKTQLGDTVTINYKGYVNDELFDGGSAENFELKLGSKTFIDTYEDQLVGKNVGWKGTVKVTFPEQYPVSKLAGQKAEFEVEILEAKRPEQVELNENNLHQLNVGSKAKTVEEAKKALTILMGKQKLMVALDKYIDEVIEQVLNSNDVTINKLILNREVSKRKDEIKAVLKQQGVKFKDYLELLGQSEEELDKLIAEEEKVKIKRSLIIMKIVDEVKKEVKIEESDYEDIYRLQALTMGMEGSSVKSFVESNPQIKDRFKAQIEDLKIKALILKKFDEAAYAKYEKALKEADKAIANYVSLEEVKAEETAEKTEEK
ncbi:trigger factor [Mycoplasmopsis columbina]|uniref:Trigger factor n=1 Tax=Mycoplasmopsis columbina SF7 TaxID=1037410 RepID=F9UKQ7_9BACT|nr:trigger factor [Mycoplasmopsis columbina]EGV00262.1 trigger factor [Mycoplasmopsis columbina SF7]VEU77151.1 Trigger factor [Mycoplasmopsis columbina]